tara:strand:+ start:92 stop:238 length:147 start_codon:yes stop_codon:yes gene_type:complete
MNKEIAVIQELSVKLSEANKEIKRLNRMIEMIHEGYTFVKTQLPNKKQ